MVGSEDRQSSADLLYNGKRFKEDTRVIRLLHLRHYRQYRHPLHPPEGGVTITPPAPLQKMTETDAIIQLIARTAQLHNVCRIVQR